MSPDEIKQVRLDWGLTQQQFADRLGRSIHTIQAWEQDKNPVPEPIARLIAMQRDLKFTVADLIRISALAKEMGITFEEAFFATIKIALDAVPADPKPKKGGK